MKLLGWALGALFAVWSAAFLSIKIYDLDCISNPSLCLAETGIWLRKLVLLEWAHNWQTLLAGAGAIMGGAFVLVATRFQIEQSNKKEAVERNTHRASEMFLAFQSLLSLGGAWSIRHDERLFYLDNTIENSRAITKVCPQLATEIIILLTHLRLNPDNYTSIHAAKLQGYSAIVVTIAEILANAKESVGSFTPKDVRMKPSVLTDIVVDTDIHPAELTPLFAYCLPSTPPVRETT